MRVLNVASTVWVLIILLPTVALAQDDLEVIAELPGGLNPGNIAVTPEGRIIVSLHQFFGPTEHRVVEVLPDGSVTPFPNEAWSRAPGDGEVGLNGVLGLNSDPSGIVWLLDRAAPGQSGKLVAWDTRADRLHRLIYLPPPVTSESPFLNDLAVDPVHGAVYIADTASGHDSALIVVDLDTGQARRRLEGHAACVPEDVTMVIDERVIRLGENEARIGVNPITVDPAYRWVYFGPMSGLSMYRVRTTDLLNFDLSEEALGERVERYGERPISDGITVDGGGNVYITDITNNAIGVTASDGTYRVLFQDDQLLSWPDGFAFGDDQFVYLTANQLHRSPPLNGGVDGSTPPYYILRFRALAEGTAGR